MIKYYIRSIKEINDPLIDFSLLQSISEDRTEKIKKYRQVDDRKRSVLAGEIINEILDSNDIPNDKLYIDEHGKPGAEGIFFNISHSGKYVFGVQSDKIVGCDVEKIEKAHMNIAEKYFSRGEKEYIISSDNPDAAFFEIWTLKEAYLKMTGNGLAGGLKSFEIEYKESHFAIKGMTDVYLQAQIFDGHIFSVCGKGDIKRNLLSDFLQNEEKYNQWLNK